MNEHDATEQAYKNGYKAGVTEFAEKLYKLLTTQKNWCDLKSAWLENGKCYWLKVKIDNLAKEMKEGK